MNNIYVTRDLGRVHLAHDERYIGSVNSYNNSITQFFTRLFGVSTQVSVNGKMRHFNKKSYVKLLHRLQVKDATVKNIQDYSDFHALRGTKVDETTLMRSHLSGYKVDRLTRKMVHALFKRNYEDAKKYAGKGADVNRNFWERGEYWERGTYGISYGSYKDKLPLKKLEVKAESFTPTTQACAAGQTQLFKFLVDLGGKLDTQGQVVQFSRSIEDVDTERRAHLAVHVFYTRWGRWWDHVYPRMHVETRVNTLFRDHAIQTHTTVAQKDCTFNRTELSPTKELENRLLRHARTWWS